LEHPRNAGVHFLFLDELSPLSLLDPALYRLEKAPVLFDRTQSDILHKLRGVSPVIAGDLGKAGKLFRGESTSMPQSLRTEGLSVNPAGCGLPGVPGF
jgi:hypothetical protein